MNGYTFSFYSSWFSTSGNVWYIILGFGTEKAERERKKSCILTFRAYFSTPLFSKWRRGKALWRQQWPDFNSFLGTGCMLTRDCLITNLKTVYNSGTTKYVTAEERILMSMSIWLGNKIEKGQIQNLINFQKSLTILLGLFLSLKLSSVHRSEARALIDPVRAFVVLHVVCKSLRYEGEQWQYKIPRKRVCVICSKILQNILY